MSDFLTIEETAELLGLSTEHVYLWVPRMSSGCLIRTFANPC